MTKANDLASLLDANGDVVSSALDNVPAAPTPSLSSLGIPNHDDITVDGSGNVDISGSSGATLTLTSTDITGANTELLGQIDFVSSDVSGGSAGTQARIKGVYEDNGDSSGIAFLTGFSTGSGSPTLNEVMRIRHEGSVLVGTTSTSLVSTSTETGAQIYDGGFVAAANDPVAYFNRITSDGSIAQFRKDGSIVGSIGTSSGSFYVDGGSGVSGVQFGVGDIRPRYNGALVDGSAADLGHPSNRWQNLYLSGGVVFGATGGAVTSKTLSDYEEGIWYPVLKASSANPTYTAGNAIGYYVKIGNMVYFSWYSGVLNITNSGSGAAKIGDLPFAASGAAQEYWLFQFQHGTGISGTNTSGGYVSRNSNDLFFTQQGTVSSSNWVTQNSVYVMVSGAYRTA